MDELYFWAGTLGIVVFALLEVVLFVWVFGRFRAWSEINAGADIRLPKVVYYVITYVTPVYLAGLLITWVIQDGKAAASMAGVKPEEVAWRWGARVLMLVVVAGLVYLTRKSRRLKADQMGGVKSSDG